MINSCTTAIVALCILYGVCLCAGSAQAVQYEPPINIVFVLHEEELNTLSNYQTRLNALLWLDSLAQTSQYPFKMSYLMSGDMAEYVIFAGDQWVFQQIMDHGHEIGTHCHAQVHIAPLTWQYYACTQRYGIPIYNPDSTERIWHDNNYWVNQITPNNTSMCVMPFLCSDEGQLMQEFGYTSDPGNRSEKALNYTNVLMHHPMNPASDDRVGHEVEEDLSNNFVYIDHYAQIGNENAHGYNCTVPYMEAALDSCYQDWLAAETLNADSMDNKVWTFGFLTHTWMFDAYYQEQVATFIQYILDHYVGHYTPRGNLIARFSTCQQVVAEYNTWKASHPGWSSYSYVYPFPTAPLVNEAMIIPWDNTQESEWVELYNPTTQWFDLSGYKINSGWLPAPDYWQFPTRTWLGPHEHMVVAHNGANFRNHYGFRPDFEVSGNTGARQLISVGDYTLHNNSDGCCLNNTVTPAYLAHVDGVSWGNAYMAGFTLPVPGMNQTWGRDALSTETGYAADWHINGGTIAPTPGGANSAAYFAPQVFIQADPASVPLVVPASGGPVIFNLKVGNELPTVQVVDLWTSAVLPNGNINGPLLLRQNRALQPQDSNLVMVTQWVPANAPPGIYRYDVHVGSYPNSVTDLSTFYFEKSSQGDGGQGGSDWSWPEAEADDIGQEAMPFSTQDQLQAPLPEKLALKAFPNPFNQSTALQLDLPYPGGDAYLQIFDLAGRMVRSVYLDDQEPGRHTITFDAAKLSSGIYLAVLRTPDQSAQQKLLLVK